MQDRLALQLVLATAVVAASVLAHLGGLLALTALLRVHAKRWMTSHALTNQVVIILGAAAGLFALHGSEIWFWAFSYLATGALKDFEAALYFSTSTYATIGYGDVVLARSWRVFGAIEGITGVILLGWSTAFFLSVVRRLQALEHNWLDGARNR